MLRVVIITHGNLGVEMLHTAETIIGKQPDAVVVTLNPEESLNGLFLRVVEIVKDISCAEGILVLTDMVGGTPCNVCLPLCSNYRMEVISGVNLYMLLSALVNAKTLQIEELAKKVVADGKKNITNVKEAFVAKLAK
jgi:PTS system mannose-specific IIA component